MGDVLQAMYEQEINQYNLSRLGRQFIVLLLQLTSQIHNSYHRQNLISSTACLSL